MFDNLKTALQHKGISMKQYAEIFGVGEKTIQNKLMGRTDFTYPEFRKTCTLLLSTMPIYLFSVERAGTEMYLHHFSELCEIGLSGFGFNSFC